MVIDGLIDWLIRCMSATQGCDNAHLKSIFVLCLCKFDGNVFPVFAPHEKWCEMDNHTDLMSARLLYNSLITIYKYFASYSIKQTHINNCPCICTAIWMENRHGLASKPILTMEICFCVKFTDVSDLHFLANLQLKHHCFLFYTPVLIFCYFCAATL